jgi:hypothetical protein
MYPPRPNEETRVEVMHEHIRAHPRGTRTVLGADDRLSHGIRQHADAERDPRRGPSPPRPDGRAGARRAGRLAFQEVPTMPRHLAPTAAALVVAALLLPAAHAHGWHELDARRALEEAAAVVAVAEAVQGAWAPAAGEADAPLGAPPELRWWTWVQARRTADDDAAVLAAIAAHAPGWLDEAASPEAAAGWWTDALGELLAHAAARDVDDAARASAMTDLRRADLDPATAARASWIALLPTLTDAERRDLAPHFARLDALVAAVAR